MLAQKFPPGGLAKIVVFQSLPKPKDELTTQPKDHFKAQPKVDFKAQINAHSKNQPVLSLQLSQSQLAP
jgi:hypothetical protein